MSLCTPMQACSSARNVIKHVILPTGLSAYHPRRPRLVAKTKAGSTARRSCYSTSAALHMTEMICLEGPEALQKHLLSIELQFAHFPSQPSCTLVAFCTSLQRSFLPYLQ